MFMRFRGGGVGHIETRHLDLKLKGDSHKSGDEQQDEATIAGIQEDSDSYSDEERLRGDRVEEDLGVCEEHTGRREAIDDEGRDDDDQGEDQDDEDQDDDDQGEDEDEDGDENNEQSVLVNTHDEQDLDDEGEEAMDDDEILDREGFAVL